MLTVAQGYAFDVERGPDWLLVRMRNAGGPNTDTPPLAERLWTLLQQHFTHRLVLELDQVESLDENMLGQLAQLGRRIEQHDGVLRLCGLSPRNREAMHTCHLDEHFLPYQDRLEAVTGCLHTR